jgi:hypothetical protein
LIGRDEKFTDEGSRRGLEVLRVAFEAAYGNAFD